MNLASRSLLCILGLALSASATAASAQFLPRGFTQPRDGIPHIESGGRFGVQIGMNRFEARNILNKQWNIHYAGTTRCPEIELGHDYCQPRAQYKDHFSVTGDLLGGNIELYTFQDKVISIEWWRNPFDP